MKSGGSMADEATHVGVETVGEWYRQLAEEAGKGLLDLEIGVGTPRQNISRYYGSYHQDVPNTQLRISGSYDSSFRGRYPSRTYSDITTIASRRGVGEKGIVSIGREFTAVGEELSEPVITRVEVYRLRPKNYSGKRGLGLIACRVGLLHGQSGITIWQPGGAWGVENTLGNEEPVSAVDNVDIGNKYQLSTFPNVVRHRMGVVGSMITQRCDLSTALGKSMES